MSSSFLMPSKETPLGKSKVFHALLCTIISFSNWHKIGVCLGTKTDLEHFTLFTTSYHIILYLERIPDLCTASQSKIVTPLQNGKKITNYFSISWYEHFPLATFSMRGNLFLLNLLFHASLSNRWILIFPIYHVQVQEELPWPYQLLQIHSKNTMYN